MMEKYKAFFGEEQTKIENFQAALISKQETMKKLIEMIEYLE